MSDQSALALLQTTQPRCPSPFALASRDGLWTETFQTDQDIRQYWRGYAHGGAVCAVLLIIGFWQFTY